MNRIIVCLVCFFSVVIGGVCAVIGFMRGTNKALEDDKKKDPWPLEGRKK